MILIVGLGNPENEYAKTRHNMGFDVINKIADKYGIEVNKNKYQALYGTGMIEGKKVMLLKPQTYMNLSGISVREVMNFYKLDPSEIIVAYDDMDIDKGIIKLRKKGGPGSHNGMKSVVKETGTNLFPRVRVGIGKPEDKSNADLVINYVIGPVSSDEYKILQDGVKKASEAIVEILKSGIDNAMNKFN